MATVKNFRYNPETDTNHYFSFDTETETISERVTKLDASLTEIQVETKIYAPSETQLLGMEWAESGKIKRV